MSLPSAPLPAILAVFLPVLGLSCLLRAPAWVRLTRPVLADATRFWFGALVMLVAGATIGLVHDTWSSPPDIFITAFGWLMAAEATMILLAPGLFRPFARLSDAFLINYTRAGGILLIAIGIWLASSYPP